MSRPLLITDCDEVLLHMAAPFRDWLSDTHAIDLDLEIAFDAEKYDRAMRQRADGQPVDRVRVPALVDDFFAMEMDRQTLVPDARDALGRIAEIAEIVVLTNLRDHCHGARVAQLDRHGIRHEVLCNQGPKGAAVATLLGRYQPSSVVFVDDLAPHHASVAAMAPTVWRLHLIADPVVAAAMPPASAAHARIDDWLNAEPWVIERLRAGAAG